MDRAKDALEKLQRIQELWFALERTEADSPEYVSLVKRIHALSSEYQKLTDSFRKSDKD